MTASETINTSTITEYLFHAMAIVSRSRVGARVGACVEACVRACACARALVCLCVHVLQIFWPEQILRRDKRRCASGQVPVVSRRREHVNVGPSAGRVLLRPRH